MKFLRLQGTNTVILIRVDHITDIRSYSTGSEITMNQMVSRYKTEFPAMAKRISYHDSRTPEEIMIAIEGEAV